MEKGETSADEAVEARGKKAVDDLKALKNNVQEANFQNSEAKTAETKKAIW